MCDNCERNSAENHPFSYENVEKLANYLKERVPIVPQIGIICGTGLGKFILYLYSRKSKNPAGCTT
jgi:hypothetical protein